ALVLRRGDEGHHDERPREEGQPDGAGRQELVLAYGASSADEPNLRGPPTRWRARRCRPRRSPAPARRPPRPRARWRCSRSWWGERPTSGIDGRRAVSYRTFTMTRTTQASEPCCPPAKEQADLRPVEGDEADEELATLSKAIAHPARVTIVRIQNRKNACSCGSIVDELPLAQSTLSQHLKVLKDAGLSRGDVDGPRVCYCIEPHALRCLRSLVGGL